MNNIYWLLACKKNSMHVANHDKVTFYKLIFLIITDISKYPW